MAENSVKLFFSYSHKDEELRDELANHLSILKQQGVISSWHDRKVLPGAEWDSQINEKLLAADIILLLISADFIASDYCWDVEVKTAMKLHNEGQACVIPVILRKVDWTGAPFGKLQFLPKNAQPVTSWPIRDEAFDNIAQGIRRVAETLIIQRQQQLAQQQIARNINRYKAKVEEILSVDGTISLPSRDTLNELREELGLTYEHAKDIEQRAFEPYVIYQQKLRKYEETFKKVIESEYPLNSRIERDLELRQRDLGIKPEDAKRIELPIRSQAESKYYQTKLQVNLQEPVEASNNSLKNTINNPQNPHPIQESNPVKPHVEETSELETEANNLNLANKLNIESKNLLKNVIKVANNVSDQWGISSDKNIVTDIAQKGISQIKEALEKSYQEKLQRYQQELSLVFRIDYPPSELTNSNLKKTQKSLGLADKDVEIIKQQITLPNYKNYQINLPIDKPLNWQPQIALTANLGDIKAVATNSVGTIVINSDGQKVNIWEVISGELLRTLTGHTDIVTTIDLSADNQILVSGSADRTFKTWHLSTGKLIRTFTGHSDWVTTVVISKDGKIIASGSADQTIKLWYMSNGNLFHTLKGHTGFVRAIAISNDNQLLASGSNDRTVKIWNLATRQLLRTLEAHTGFVRSVAISPDGKTIASAGEEGHIKIWDVVTGELKANLTEHIGNVASVAITADGNRLISGGDDKTLKVWSLVTGQLENSLEGHIGRILSVRSSLDGYTLVSGGQDKSVRVWSLKIGL
ncbi:TIR domain-containing protein [Aliinostoc sp. HNIBRCY26]|uniref:TIR domain-containing protein n=1 Tax=Aliinostoc sp. HNIBRCY26 TaxID=3418997 RepID=UPI003CFC3340